jgi:hypothetical protein
MPDVIFLRSLRKDYFSANKKEFILSHINTDLDYKLLLSYLRILSAIYKKSSQVSAPLIVGDRSYSPIRGIRRTYKLTSSEVVTAILELDCIIKKANFVSFIKNSKI